MRPLWMGTLAVAALVGCGEAPRRVACAPTTRQVTVITAPISGSNLPSAVSMALLGQTDPFTAVENHPAFINWINTDEHAGAYCRYTNYYEGADGKAVLAVGASPVQMWPGMLWTGDSTVQPMPPYRDDGAVRQWFATRTPASP